MLNVKPTAVADSQKKLWHRLFYFLIDIPNVNALMLETPNVETLSQKDFRVQLTAKLVTSLIKEEARAHSY